MDLAMTIPVARVFAKSATIVSAAICLFVALLWIVSYFKAVQVRHCTDDSRDGVFRQRAFSVIAERGLIELSCLDLRFPIPMRLNWEPIAGSLERTWIGTRNWEKEQS